MRACTDRITDYCVDPVELGYRNRIDFDRYFIGSEALRTRAANQKRTKVTLVRNTDDVFAVNQDALAPKGKPAKFIAMPLPMFATFESDTVMKNGVGVGVSQWSSWSANAGALLALALVDVAHAEPGTGLTLVWGEPNSKRPTVESHELREIRVTVAPPPYFEKVIKSVRQ
ncbi:MAG: hypothetical protein ACRET4_17850 [Steroidobacteraceae bacterium]